MDRFQIDNGMVFFVFANEDTYFLNSLLKVNLNQLLWHELNDAGYEGIYFFGGVNQNYWVDLCDENSDRTFDEVGTKSFASKLFGKPKKPFEQARTVDFSDMQSVCQKVDDILCQKEERQAVVMKMDTFCQIYGYYANREYLLHLIRQGSIENLENSQNILVLVSSLKAESTKENLMKAIWEEQDEQGNCLCPELRGILHAKKIRLFPALKKYLNERYVVLNQFSYDQIHTLVHRVLLENPERECSASEMDDMSRFLCHWIHSTAFRKNTKTVNLMEIDRYRSFQKLFKELMDSTVWDQIYRKALEIRRNGNEAYRQNEQLFQEKWKKAIYDGTEAIVRNDSLYIEAQEVWSSLTTGIKKEFSSIWNRRNDDIINTFAHDCFAEINGAINAEDSFMAGKAVNALEWYVNSDSYLDREALYAGFELQRQILAAVEKLSRVRHFEDKYYQQIDEIYRMYPEEVANNTLPKNESNKMAIYCGQYDLASDMAEKYEMIVSQCEISINDLGLNATAGNLQQLEQKLKAQLAPIDEEFRQKFNSGLGSESDGAEFHSVWAESEVGKKHRFTEHEMMDSKVSQQIIEKYKNNKSVL